MTTGDWLGLASGALILISMGAFFYRVLKVNVPRVRAGYFTAMLIAAGLGMAAFAFDATWVGTIPAILGISLGLIFPTLRLQSAQNKKQPAVAPGEPMINFTATDDSGRPFELASLMGQPILLKFFRGHW
tara:strand:+ start:54340 stop:54729 length:390 start_codon:yes stop_codon:yes gene_type:complete